MIAKHGSRCSEKHLASIYPWRRQHLAMWPKIWCRMHKAECLASLAFPTCKANQMHASENWPATRITRSHDCQILVMQITLITAWDSKGQIFWDPDRRCGCTVSSSQSPSSFSAWNTECAKSGAKVLWVCIVLYRVKDTCSNACRTEW